MREMLPNDEDIAAIEPIYSERGDVTRIYLAHGGERVVDAEVRAVLRALASRHDKTVELMRRHAERYTHRRLYNPLAASAGLVLVPVKMRRPRVKGDAALGHVNVAALHEVAGDGSGSVISIGAGRRLRTPWSLRTTHRHIEEAEHMRSDMVREMCEYFVKHYVIE